MSFLSLLQAAAPGGPSAGLGSMLIPVVLMFAIMYFFLVRPQKKRQQETEKMLAALKKGDKVVTIGGIHGVISSVKEKTVIIKVDDNTKIEFNRSAVATVIKPESEKLEKQEKAKEKDNTEDKSEQNGKTEDASENVEEKKDN